MLSRAWKQTPSDPASRSHTVNPLPPIPPLDVLPSTSRLLCLLGKTSVLSSAHFSRLSAVHNHETACGILQFNTPPLNRGTKGKRVSGGNGTHSEPFGSEATYRSHSYSFIECALSFTLSTSFSALKACCHIPVHGGCTPDSLSPHTWLHKPLQEPSIRALHKSISLLCPPALISIPKHGKKRKPRISQL